MKIKAKYVGETINFKVWKNEYNSKDIEVNDGDLFEFGIWGKTNKEVAVLTQDGWHITDVGCGFWYDSFVVVDAKEVSDGVEL